MSLLDEVDEYIKKSLSERRYRHSIGVMKRAEELALIYNVDVEKAKLCGLAHDMAKEMDKEAMLIYVKENNIEIDEIEKINLSLLHGKIGADIAKKKFGFDLDMQKAIMYHTTTDPEMDMLAKIIFVADKTEGGRSSERYDVEYERSLSNEDIDEAIIFMLNNNIKYMIAEDKIIHPKSLETRNRIIINKKL